ncbi:MAG: nitroreductase/dihydropteridine reductase [Arenicella sp.]|jgi:nitroreductase/dihydropteridine reductase
MDLITALNKRYATKKFDPTKKLSATQVEDLIESARLTATSYGAQLMKIVLVENKEIREKLVDCSFGQRQVADASHLIVICRERDLDLSHFNDYMSRVSEVRDVELEKLDGFKNMMSNAILTKSNEEQEAWMSKQCYIALGNLLTACAVLGIDSCPMEGFLPEEYDEILALEAKGLSAVLVLPIGIRADDCPNIGNKKVRRKIDDFLVKI